MSTSDPIVLETRERGTETVPDTEEVPLTFRIKNLSIWYGEKRAINDVTLDISANAVTSIIGPSGCGKSTLLRSLNRMHELVPGTRIEGHKPGTSLSGGQQQRLCIARALAVEPEVILMDEPCSALDPIATAKIEELIHDLKAQYTIVIVTHNMQQAGRVSDYTAFLYLGRLVEFGPTTKIFTNPSDPQTEDYITGRFG